MSADAARLTATATATATATSTTHSYWCNNCNACVHFSTYTSTTLYCPHCHAHSLHHHHFPNPNPNPNFPFIIVFGPFPQPPLHSSDAIDFDDHETFNLILSRIAAAAIQDHQFSTRTSKSFVDSIKSIKYSEFWCQMASTQCAICKDEFTVDANTAQLPCKHLFHYECIVPWLNRSNLCPLCRFQLPAGTKSGPLMKYVVRLGDTYVEGWGEDYESGYRDAVLRNGLGGAMGNSDSESTRMGRAETETGPANSGETISSPLDDVDGQVDGAESKFEIDPVMVDEYGDTVMRD